MSSIEVELTATQSSRGVRPIMQSLGPRHPLQRLSSARIFGTNLEVADWLLISMHATKDDIQTTSSFKRLWETWNTRRRSSTVGAARVGRLL
jgi:hypothetical protein